MMVVTVEVMGGGQILDIFENTDNKVSWWIGYGIWKKEKGKNDPIFFVLTKFELPVAEMWKVSR